MSVSNSTFNEVAMKIILHAGDCRNLVNEALKDLEEGAPIEQIDNKMKEAKNEIIKAHKIQTDIIQSTIEDESVRATLLFTHAQDTLMTIYSEMNIAQHLIALYKKLEDKINDK